MPVEKVQVLTVVAGTMACNAKCPYCVSKMTTDPELYKAFNFKDVEWANFDIAVNQAIAAGANTVLFTGKGEPALFPKQVDDYLKFLQKDKYSKMSMKELQTNGMIFHKPEFKKQEWLKKWREKQLSTMCLSLFDVNHKKNKAIFSPNRRYSSVDRTIDMLQDEGYTIRLSFMMANGSINSPRGIDRIVEYAKRKGIPQLSARPVRRPKFSYNSRCAQWVDKHGLSDEQIKKINDYVEKNKDTAVLDKFMHGATVYEFKGQNLCLTDCLTFKPDEKGFRQLIFYSNGMLTYDWIHPGAVILDMGAKCRKYLKK